MDTQNQKKSVIAGLAFCAGTGLTLMIVAAGLGVVQGVDADGNLIGILFVAGIAMLIVGIVAWFGVVQPHREFDDINVPHYHGHEEHDEHAPAEH